MLIFQTDFSFIFSYDILHVKELLSDQENILAQKGYTLPENFAKYNVSYLVLVNSYNYLFYLIIALVIGLLMELFRKKICLAANKCVCLNNNTIKQIAFIIYTTIAWNLIIWLILSIIPEL